MTQNHVELQLLHTFCDMLPHIFLKRPQAINSVLVVGAAKKKPACTVSKDASSSCKKLCTPATRGSRSSTQQSKLNPHHRHSSGVAAAGPSSALMTTIIKAPCCVHDVSTQYRVATDRMPSPREDKGYAVLVPPLAEICFDLASMTIHPSPCPSSNQLYTLARLLRQCAYGPQKKRSCFVASQSFVQPFHHHDRKGVPGYNALECRGVSSCPAVHGCKAEHPANGCVLSSVGRGTAMLLS
jgi:hypothetical protein